MLSCKSALLRTCFGDVTDWHFHRGFNLCGLRTAAIIVGGINIPLILLIEFMSARHQVRIKKNLIVSSEPLELGHYHKITDVTVTERMLSQVETNAEYIT